MVRVIYRWQVTAENFEAFKNAWCRVTNQIHESVAGAQGSFMLRSNSNTTEVLTIAKWDSLEAWRSFWGDQKPKEMEAMRKLGKQVSAEVYDEIEDYTR